MASTADRPPGVAAPLDTLNGIDGVPAISRRQAHYTARLRSRKKGKWLKSALRSQSVPNLGGRQLPPLKLGLLTRTLDSKLKRLKIDVYRFKMTR